MDCRKLYTTTRVSLPNASEPSVLRLVRNGSSFVAIAKSPSKEELDLLRECILQLRVHLIDDPTVERLVRAHVDLKDARNASTPHWSGSPIWFGSPVSALVQNRLSIPPTVRVSLQVVEDVLLETPRTFGDLAE